jgi:hypothetical protein
MYGYSLPDDPIGPEPSRQTPDQRAVWHQAFAALSSPTGSDVRTVPDGRLWLLRDTYAAETAWAPRHAGKELRLARLGAFDTGLGAIRAAAEAAAAHKVGDHSAAERHETLAASYRTLREAYQQRERALALAIADRQDWEQTTADSRHLAIAADAELRRRHPAQKIGSLRSAEPVTVIDTERDGKLRETGTWVYDLAAQHHAFREKLNERQHLLPGDDPDWSAFSGSSPSWWAPRRGAILQPPKPEISPSATILQLAAEHDIEPEAAG